MFGSTLAAGAAILLSPQRIPKQYTTRGSALSISGYLTSTLNILQTPKLVNLKRSFAWMSGFKSTRMVNARGCLDHRAIVRPSSQNYSCIVQRSRMMFKLSSVLIVAVLVVCGSVSAQLSSYYTADDVSSLVLRAKEIISSTKSLKGAYHALSLMKSVDRSDYECQCNAVKDLLSKASTGYDVFYASSIGNTCNCNFGTIPSAATVAKKAAQVRMITS